MTREFIRLHEFEKRCKQVGLTEDNIRDIELTILSNPNIGVLMTGSGGVRKFRESLEKSSKGKSSGSRVIYVDFAYYEKTFLLTIVLKNESDNLTQSEKNELRKLVKILENELKKRGK